MKIQVLHRPLLGLSFLALTGPTWAVPQGVTRQSLPPASPKDGSLVSAPPADHGESLERLGISTDETPRLDDHGNPLPDAYSPFGETMTLGRRTELFLGGLVHPNGGIGTLLEDAQDLQEPDGINDDPPVLTSRTSAEAPWLIDETTWSSPPQTTRAMTLADVDDDGFEETVAVYIQGFDVRLNILDDAGAGFAETDVSVGSVFGGLDIALASADLDGDGSDELVLGLCTADLASLWFLSDQDGGFALLHSKSYTPELLNGSMSFEIDTGELDNDLGSEVAVVLNEIRDICFGTGVSRVFVYDDATAGFQELHSGYVEGLDTSSGIVERAVVGDVSLGDIDGDNLDEILMAGLTGFSSCSQADPSDEGVFVALDDALSPEGSGFGSLGVTTIQDLVAGSSDADLALRFLDVNTPDLDHDGRDEVLVNHILFQNWGEAAPWTPVPELSLPEAALYGAAGNGNRAYSTATSAIAIGDYTGNGHDDVFVYSTAANSGKVRVYGVDPLTGDMALLLEENWAGNGPQSAPKPILVPVNVDDDSAIVRFLGGHILDFTEPVVLCAMATPPCKTGVGQNLDACVTTFGNTTSIGTEGELTVTVSTSGSFGVNVEGGAVTQSEATVKATMTVELSLMTSVAYNLEKTITYSSGANEDSVLFSTVPIDRYSFEVLVHEDPTLVGKLLDVYIPRDPALLFVERGFYNDNVVANGLHIGEDVFEHEVGDPDTYPTVAEKNILLGANGGLENGPVSVGQGGGSTELEIAVGTEYGVGAALALGFEMEAEVIAGTVLVGFTVGASVEASLSVTSGHLTTYTGAVGHIDAAHFAQNAYDWGIFTYVQHDQTTGQEFEVINYWVQ